MVFNSIPFLTFFIVFFILYWIINKLPFHYRNLFTLLSSYFFYGWWDWRFLGLIIISSLSDYVFGLQIERTGNKLLKKIYLILSIVINLGILGFFKYFNFFLDSLDHLLNLVHLSVGKSTLNIILPVGISFYTFQTLSYTIDIYRDKMKPTKDIISFFTFVAFFPQLVAGPIERARRLLHQFQEKKVFNYSDAVTGLRWILWGLFKKIVIADNVGLLADHFFSTDISPARWLTITGSILFGIQIYCDFSGYSDIAVGVAKILGYDLIKNFKTPYFSGSFTELWHRWHISLSTWFRDYVYIPLGGNQKSPVRVNLNVFITFLLSGLWHGAKITFLIWGMIHGLLLIIEKRIKFKLNAKITIIFVFLITSLLWIPFRAGDFDHFLRLSGSLLNSSGSFHETLAHFMVAHSTTKLWILLITFLLFVLIEYRIGLEDFNEWIRIKKVYFRYIIYYWLILSILLLGNFDIKPYFIYFQF
ncbi:MAG: hypothetical protein AMS27_05735 [Bacteroides sp. SM23_62_1]|nr:MAG: hypothetical protein AMS27_05735 [Bacteroides sp. SM23_62_1]